MPEPRRFAMTVRLRPSHREEYLRLHAAVWPAVEDAMRREGMANFSIFLHDDTLFGYYEFAGDDHDAAQARIAADPASQRWWALTDPCQEPAPGRPDRAPWAPMTEVWHLPDRPSPAIVDAHVHLWDPDALPYPWLDGTPLRRRRDTADFAAAAPEVDAIVVVQADTAAERAVDEVRWVASVALERPRLLGVVAYAPVEVGPTVQLDLDALLAAGPVVGIRRLLQDEPDGFTRSDRFDRGIRALTAAGLPFDLCVRAHQLEEIADLVDRHPGQRFVLDHLGKPAVGDPDAFEPWRRRLTRFAAHPGVVVKLSGLAGELVPGATLAAARPYLDAALEVFGPHRALYASDWPVLTLHGDNAAWRELVDDALTGCSEADRADVLGGNARRVYRRVDGG